MSLVFLLLASKNYFFTLGFLLVSSGAFVCHTIVDSVQRNDFIVIEPLRERVLFIILQ
jgi:hypothetical protein